MKVILATVQVPFIRGGAEVLAESLRENRLGYFCVVFVQQPSI